jgi:hypothetical protein
MKKSGLYIPFIMAGIVLILVIVTALTRNDFKRTPAETLQLAKGSKQFIGPAGLSSMPADKIVIIELGVEKVLPSFPSTVEIRSIDYSQLLSKEICKVFADNKKKKIIYAPEVALASKAWTFLTCLGYNELYIFDPDYKTPQGQSDTLPGGNEELHYTFKPEKTEAQ